MNYHMQIDEESIAKQTQKNESKIFLPFVFLFIALVGLDQITKYFAKKIFENHKFAFSLPMPMLLIYFIYFVVLGAIVIYCKNNYRNFSSLQITAWILIFSGALSNISERFVLGYVRDWIYILTGIFNLADFCILLGVIILFFKFEILSSKS